MRRIAVKLDIHVRISLARNDRLAIFVSWLAVRIFFELLHGFRTLHFVGPCVSVFGSARFPPGHPSYELARAVGTPTNGPAVRGGPSGLRPGARREG